MAGLSAILLWFSRSSDFTLVRSMTVIPAACSFDLYGSFDGSICPSAPSLSLRTAQRETFTRRGYDWPHRYIRIVQAAAELPVNAAIMERLSLSATHRLPDCQALGQELRHSNSPRLIFYAFDLLHRNGRELRQQPADNSPTVHWGPTVPWNATLSWTLHEHRRWCRCPISVLK